MKQVYQRIIIKLMKYSLLSIVFFCLSWNTLFAQVLGCNDRPANNYQSSATQNNGTCQYDFLMMYPTFKYNPGTILTQIGGTIAWNDTLWAINDHGGNYIYALDSSSSASPVVKRSVQIDGATVIDWEEITQDANYIYIGDFGNNVDGNRTDLKIYKISKNDVQHNSVVTPQIINFSYADQTIVSGNSSNNTNYDCECILIINNKIYLFTKEWITMGTSVYEIPSTNAGTYSATKISTFATAGLITGGDYLARDKIIALTGYTTKYERFIYLLYDYTGTNFFGGNARKVTLYNSFKTEGISFKNPNTIYLSSEFILMPPPYPNLLQRVEELDISELLASYRQKLALPINYIQFDSKSIKNSVKLNWEILPSDEFVKGEVERKFNTYSAYQPIESMLSSVSSFTDNDVLLNNPVVYYRLKVLDKDNKVNYSKELSVNKKDIKSVNFNSNASMLTVDSDSKLGGTIRVFQTDGKIICQSVINQQIQTINISNLPAGIYNAIVQQGGITSSYRFYKGL